MNTALVLLMLSTAPAAELQPPLGTRVAEFTLPEPSTKKDWALADNTRTAKATVMVFASTACPVSTNYVSRLSDLKKTYAKDNVAWVGVCSHEADDAASIAKYVKDAEYPFPLLHDEGGALATKLHIERVPTVVVLDSTRTVRYIGRIDDQYSPGVSKVKASSSELADALAAVITGKDVAVASAPAAGCKLLRPKAEKSAAEITYHKHAAIILQNKCQECHRPGEVGPFPLMNFKQAKSWAGMMREVIADDVMPPWHATAPMGHFKNDRRLTTDEKKTLLAWIDQGCAEGDTKDGPPAKTYADGWRLGREPDEVFRMKHAIKVRASGEMPYSCVQVGERFKEDRWVTAVEVRPQQRAVVHHIIAFVLPPDTSPFNQGPSDFAKYMLGAYVPGDQPIISSPGQAKKIPKGSMILLEIHYTPNGKAVEDRSSIGLCYTDKKPEMEIQSLAVMNEKLRIPPEAENHEVKAKHTFDKETTIESLTPHMHVRGKAFRYELITKDGKRETVLDVPKYDFNWQSSYIFAKPLVVPAGSTMECTAWYDNSAKNPFNPDPKKMIRWGDMTSSEMMIGFVMYHEGK